MAVIPLRKYFDLQVVLRQGIILCFFFVRLLTSRVSGKFLIVVSKSVHFGLILTFITDTISLECVFLF